MVEKKKSKIKNKAENPVDNLEEELAEDYSSGAEAYEEQADPTMGISDAEADSEESDENIDYEKIKQDLLREYAEKKELEKADPFDEPEQVIEDVLQEDPVVNEETEVPVDEPEQVIEDVLQEDPVVNEETEVPVDEPEQVIEDVLQEDSVENKELEMKAPVDQAAIDTNMNDYSSEKISADDDLEIEDIQENLDGDVINKPRSLNQENYTAAPDVDQGISKVAISKGSSLAILVGLVLLLIYVIYKILQPSEEELAAQKSTINKNLPIITPVEDNGQTIVVPEIPAFPDMPKELTPPAPKALPTPPAPSTLDLAPLSAPTLPVVPAMAAPAAPPAGGKVAPLQSSKVNISAIDREAAAREAAEAARKKARMKSSIMVGGGSGGGSKNKNNKGQTLSILERNSNQTVATHIGDLQRVIAQGKIIDAVLETAINTDLPGLIRGVVTMDVYSEAGNNILITKGSRLIGSYSSEVKFGQARVQIVWDRVIRPDGVDIQVSSPGVDDIGRSGSAGAVDNHILRNFTTAMMVSLINIGVAEYADSNGTSSSTSTTTTNTDGSTTNTDDSSTVDQAYDEAINNISSIGTDVIDKTKDMPPTITIDQGTSLKVFVKQDLVFPGKSANLTRLVE